MQIEEVRGGVDSDDEVVGGDVRSVQLEPVDSPVAGDQAESSGLGCTNSDQAWAD